MRFTKQDYDYLSGKLFSNGYDFRLEGNPAYSRTGKLLEIVKGASCLHVGCCDHIPLIAQKVAANNWLHGLLEKNCRYVLGIDINQEAVDYVNQSGFAVNPVYCADITSPGFVEAIPAQSAGFDYVLLGEILEHVDDPASFLRQMDSNMAKLGFRGTYIITVPNAFCMLRPGKYASGIECVNSDHRYWFTPYTIAKVMFSAGILPTELWFVNCGSYAVEKSYQSDQIIIAGSTRGTGTAGQRPGSGGAQLVKSLEDMISSGKLSDALDFIEALPQETRQIWQIQNLTGVACAVCGQHKEALTFFNAALEQQPNDADLLYNLADTYAALGMDRQAKEALERCRRCPGGKDLADDIAALDQRLDAHGKLPDAANGAGGDGGPRYLVICNGGYPAEGNPRCMFAHERVLQYVKAGLNVDAFGFIWEEPLQEYEYQGVKVTQGGAPELKKVLQTGNYQKLLIHFADLAVMYSIIEAGKLNMPMIIWCHGYEVLPWYRCWFNYTPDQIRQNKKALEKDNAAKKDRLQKTYSMDNLHFIFVSEWLMERSKKFVGFLPKHRDVIHNYINYDFFASPAKSPEDRMHILSIKNHATRTYANDLTAKAILELSQRPFFSELTFELYGDGELFEENFGELQKRNFPNVHIQRKFLSHEQMREAFRKNGVFLSPTRMDSQQLAMCEAMAAGMSVITSSAGAIREFMDEDCGSLFEFDNYWMMAEEIEYLYYHPEEFLRKSANAVRRIRTQCSYEQTIGRELRLITD